MYGYSRQAWYDRRRRRNQLVDDAIIVELVLAQRQRLQYVGGKKLYALLKPSLVEHGVTFGRDKFLAALGRHGLMQPRARRRGPQTTDSRHGYRRYPNLVKELKITRPEQVWVSDMTYLRLRDGFCYLWLITDAYSKRIMGYNVNKNATAEGSLRALRMALGARQYDEELIHHSDRAKQYASAAYVKMLRKAQVKISMTGDDHAAENAIAERINRTLKYEFALGETVERFTQMRHYVSKAIQVYNTIRPHLSCYMMTPEEAHKQANFERKKWSRKPQSFPQIHKTI